MRKKNDNKNKELRDIQLDINLCDIYGFKTERSKKIKNKLILYTLKNIDRTQSINKLNRLLDDIVMSVEIENGIFEFSLIFVMTKNISHIFSPSVYNDKLNDILDNLDYENSNINNNKFFDFVKKQEFDFFHYIAFLSPMQLFPSNWAPLIKTINLKEEVLYKQKTTDEYKCSRCKERKFVVYEMQLRSADEPSTFFYTCTVCYKTFKR